MSIDSTKMLAATCHATRGSVKSPCLRLLHKGLTELTSCEVDQTLVHPAALVQPLGIDELVGSALWAVSDAILPDQRLFKAVSSDSFTCASSADCKAASQSLFLEAPFWEAPLPLSVPGPVYVCGPTSSSLDVARYLAAARCFSPWASVLAHSQNRGRGQLGRGWVSPPGNVYATLRLPMGEPFAGLAAAPAVGALAAEALAMLGVEVWVKWPNDLLIFSQHHGTAHWCKVGGILLEERQGILVAGMGLNMHSAPLGTDLRSDAAFESGVLPMQRLQAIGINSPCALWLHVLKNMHALCNTAEGWDWRALAHRHLAFMGQQVRVVDGPHLCDVQQGRLAGLDTSGGLMLYTNEGVRVLHSGSLQPLTFNLQRGGTD